MNNENITFNNHLKTSLNELLTKTKHVSYLPSETAEFDVAISHGNVRIFGTLSVKYSGGILCNFIDITIGESETDINSDEILSELDDWETKQFDLYQSVDGLITAFVLSYIKPKY